MWVASGVGGSAALGVYDHPPPDGSSLGVIEVPEEDLFWFDRSMVRGAAQATRYRDRLQEWFAGVLG